MSSGCLLPRRRRQELPDTIAPTWTPRPVVDACGVEEALQAEIDLVAGHAEGLGHAIPAEERGAAAVRGEGEQREHSNGVWPDFGEPAVVKQTGRQPAEGALWSPLELGPRRHRWRAPGHDGLRLRDFAARSCAFCSARSVASFLR